MINVGSYNMVASVNGVSYLGVLVITVEPDGSGSIIRPLIFGNSHT